MSLSIYKQLYEYAFQLTDDVDESHRIVLASIDGASGLLGSRTPKELHALMISTCRNKAYEFTSRQEYETRIIAYAAKKLDLPVGVVRQAIRAIREGRYLVA